MATSALIFLPLVVAFSMFELGGWAALGADALFLRQSLMVRWWLASLGLLIDEVFLMRLAVFEPVRCSEGCNLVKACSV